ncbi:hypothetical protein EBR21_17690, partial [bacterium]|nr:hypothetical protein [bacterium]
PSLQNRNVEGLARILECFSLSRVRTGQNNRIPLRFKKAEQDSVMDRCILWLEPVSKGLIENPIVHPHKNRFRFAYSESKNSAPRAHHLQQLSM